VKEPRVKKEYDLPGQSRETPEETDPMRKFYTSLLEQNPDSAMAKKWCVMHGLLSAEEAEEWVRQNKGAGARALTPIKASANGSSRAASSNGNSSRGAVKRPSSGGGAKSAVSKAKPAAGGAKAKPGAKRPAAKGVKARRQHAFDDSEEDAGDDSSSDDEVPLAKRAKA